MVANLLGSNRERNDIDQKTCCILAFLNLQEILKPPKMDFERWES